MNIRLVQSHNFFSSGFFRSANYCVSGVSLRIGETGEYWKVTGELLWKGKALSRNKQNLAGEFCVVSGEFSDLRCLMNTLVYVLWFKFILNLMFFELVSILFAIFPNYGNE